MRARALLVLAVLVAAPAWATAPDLTASMVSGPSTAALGSTITLQATLSNAGDAPVGAEFKYTWFISSDRAVTISDVALGTSMNPDLPAGQAVTVSSGPLTLPAGLPVGNAWVGVCVNFDPQGSPRFGAAESSLTNNCATASVAVVLSSPQLAIVTPPALPGATQFAPWGVQLEASGGNGTYAWAMATGSALPLGLRLEGATLVGSPQLTGSFTFKVQVGSGTASASADFTLVVSAGELPLTLVQQSLPSAEYGRFYEVPLLATGGKPPYVWTGSPVPPGMNVIKDGFVRGVPEQTGSFDFGVLVTDAAGHSQTATLTLKVVVPFGLHIGVTHLMPALLQHDYVQPLVAVGGKAPYAWAVTGFQQLPEDATEIPGDLIDSLPFELGLRIENGALRGVAKQAGLYAMSLKVTDATGAADETRLLFTVTYDDPIQIVTTTLPDAFIDTFYDVKLLQNRSTQSTGVRFSLPCVQVPKGQGQFECQAATSKEMVPLGLKLSEDGNLTGTPAFQDVGVYAFLVLVTDENGRRDLRSLSIRVQPATELKSGGCSGTAAAPSLLFSLLAVAGIRRKKANP